MMEETGDGGNHTNVNISGSLASEIKDQNSIEGDSGNHKDVVMRNDHCK